jgi:hypothetical protein
MIEKQCLFSGQDNGGIYVHLLHPGYDDSISLVKEAKVSAPVLEDMKSFLKEMNRPTGKTYVLVSALGAGEFWGSNSNADFFPEQSLIHIPKGWHDLPHSMQKAFGAKWEWGYPTFYNANAFAHHQNKDPNRAFGSIVRATWDDPMKRVLLIVELDHAKVHEMGADSVVDKINGGLFGDTSMGTRVPFDLCSVCTDWSRITGNPKKDLAEHRKNPIRGLSVTTSDYCSHLKFESGKIYPDGRKVWMWNLHPRFFDISFVFVGADKTSKVLAKLASGACPIQNGVAVCPKGCTQCNDQGVIKSAHIHNVWSRSSEGKEKAAEYQAFPEFEDVDPKTEKSLNSYFEAKRKKFGLTKKALVTNQPPLAAPPKRSLAKDFLAGVDPTGTKTFDYGLADHDVSNQEASLRSAVGIIGGVLGGAITVPAGISGAIGAGQAFGKARGGIGSRLAAVPGGFLYGAKKPFSQLYHASRASNVIGKARSSGAAALTDADLGRLKKFKELAIPSDLNTVRGSNVISGLTESPQIMRKAISAMRPDELAALQSSIKGEATAAGLGLGLSGVIGGGSAGLQYSRGRMTGRQHAMEVSNARNTPLQKESFDELGYLAKAFGVNKTAGVDLSKQAEIIKRIQSHFNKALPDVEREEPDLPNDVLEEIAERPKSGLSTLTGVGIVLRPREFQRVSLVSNGLRELADHLDNRGMCFKPTLRGESSDFRMGSEILPRLLEMLRPFIGSRSALEPPLKRRVLKIIVMGRSAPNAEHVDHPVMDKLASDYLAYRQQLVYNITDLVPKAVHSHPELWEDISGDLFQNGGSGLVKASGDMIQSVLGMFPATYINRAYMPGPVVGYVEDRAGYSGLREARALAASKWMA